MKTCPPTLRCPKTGRCWASISAPAPAAPLGRGALARVYRARHRVLDRTYAVKVLYGAAHERAHHRLRREAEALGRLRHPRIVSIVDFGTTPSGHAFLTMELIEGRTLHEIMASEPRLPGSRVARLARQIAEALAYAHEAGVVHRDIKPSNIMVGDHDDVKVLDFGIARLRDADGTRLTATNALLGTPRFMAPEQILGASQVGPAADLYALGALMYAMLGGEPPFNGTTLEVVEQQIAKPPEPLPTQTGLESLVMRLLDKEPAPRPTAKAVIEALQPFTPDPARDVPAPPGGGDRPSAQQTAAPLMPSSGPPADLLSPRAGVPWSRFVGLAVVVAALSAVITARVLSRAPSSVPIRPGVIEVVEPQASPRRAPSPAPEMMPPPLAVPRADPTNASASGLSVATRPDEAIDSPAPATGVSPTRASETPSSTATDLASARRLLRQQGLTESDIREDPQLRAAWAALSQNAADRDVKAVRGAQGRFERAVRAALTAERVTHRLNAFAQRLRQAASRLPGPQVAAFEDRYFDLRASAPARGSADDYAALLRQLSRLDDELEAAAPPE